LVPLDRVASLADLQAQARLLEQEGRLSAPEVKALDFPALLAFWTSETGRQILAHAGQVQREIPFTARFTPEDLAALGLCPNAGALHGEYFVARGQADLAVLLPREIWLLDFKTDRLAAPAQAESLPRYSRQLKLYALGLSRIYRRPVTRCWLHFLSLRQTLAVE
jgi:ATP-dependent helicase/nuclease subunit A